MRVRLPLVLSTAALFVSLLAATPLGNAAHQALVPRNSVGTIQLRRNAVTSSKIAPNAIRTSQIVDGSLLTTDFKPGQIPQGPKGDKGDKGSRGDPGVSGYEIVTRASENSTNQEVLVATCPTGKRAFGGGASSSGWSAASGPYISSSAPTFDGSAWQVTIGTVDGNPANLSITVYAICGTVS